MLKALVETNANAAVAMYDRIMGGTTVLATIRTKDDARAAAVFIGETLVSMAEDALQDCIIRKENVHAVTALLVTLTTTAEYLTEVSR